MWFWVFMFICDLLIPVLMILCGFLMYRHTPKEINGWIGYRTTMSRKNMQTWKFAHDYCGRLWVKIGVVMLTLSIPVHFPFLHGSEDAIGILGGILVTIQCVTLIASIFPVEKALKKKFDSDGNLR